MQISLIVCTRDRAAQLGQALDAFARIETRLEWELLAVDNGSSDDTAQVLRDFAQRFPRARVLSEPRAGGSRAKNLGWKSARGEIIALTDDDCYPREDFIDRVWDCFQDPTIGYLGGRVLLFDPTDYRMTIQEREDRVELPARSFVPAGLIHGANFSIRRALLERVGGFDVRLGPGTPLSAEEVDVMARVSGLGWKGAYDPRPVVYHHHRRKLASDAQKAMTGYDLGRGAYYLKGMLNPSIRSPYFKAWLRAIPRQNPRRTLRELRGSAMYVKGMLDGWLMR